MAVKKFLKFDTDKGFLDNKDDINYYATTQMRKVVFGGMLGDFDENGIYVISQKIVNELIAMPKVIVDAVDGSELMRSKVKADTFFHFILSVEGNKATLSLLEKIYHQSNKTFNSGAYSDINEYVLDQVIVPDKDFNRNALYQKYNIIPQDDGEALTIFDADEQTIALYYNIIEKIKINHLTQDRLILKEKEIEELEANYFEQVLALLAEFPIVEKEVVKEVQDVLVEKHNFVIVSNPFFQQTVNEIVDSSVDKHAEKLEQDKKEEFLAKLRQIKAEYYDGLKKLLSIQIKQSAGVRFNASQVSEEGIIGSLVRELETKGYTSSDIRRVLINDDELQLTIEKIKSIVEEDKKECVRNNFNAKELTKDRPNTKKFYDDLAKERQVDMLNPDKHLINEAIDNANVKENKADVTVSTGLIASKGSASNTKKAESASSTKKADNTKKAANTKKASTNSKVEKPTTKTPPKATTGGKKTETTKKPEVKQSSISNLDYIGIGVPSSDKTKDKEEAVEEFDEFDISEFDDVLNMDRRAQKIKTINSNIQKSDFGGEFEIK